MRFSKQHTLSEIAEIIGCTYIGASDFPIDGMNEIHVVKEGEIVFVDHPKYYDKALQSPASVILINKEVECPKGKALLISDDPFRDFNKLSAYFRPFIPTSSPVSETAEIGEHTVIMPNVFIGNHVKIGKNCIIYPNVVIGDYCEIGNDVIIYSGTVLGADAFYYKKRPEGFDQLRSSGRVIIKDKVHIGSLCTIDRGVTGDTTVEEGTKIDNQVHIGHDTIIGKKCLIAAQSGIAGCVVVRDEVTIWGQVGTTSGITIGEKAIILGQTGVTKSLEGNTTYFGSPAEEARTKYKQMVEVKKLSK